MVLGGVITLDAYVYVCNFACYFHYQTPTDQIDMQRKLEILDWCFFMRTSSLLQ